MSYLINKSVLIACSALLFVVSCAPRKYAKQPRYQNNEKLALYEGKRNNASQINSLNAPAHTIQSSIGGYNQPTPVPYSPIATGSISPANQTPYQSPNMNMQQYSNAVPYKVQMGDTVYAIGRKFNVAPRDIQMYNNMLNPNSLSIGQTIYVPNGNSNVKPYSQGASNNTINNTIGTDKSNVFFKIPNSGRIIQDYDGKNSHSVKIMMPNDTTIRTSAAGEVIFVGNIDNYGKIVLIRHEGDYISNFANLGNIYVKQGQRLAKGDAIAKVKSDNGIMSEITYELRKGTKTVNPKDHIASA